MGGAERYLYPTVYDTPPSIAEFGLCKLEKNFEPLLRSLATHLISLASPTVLLSERSRESQLATDRSSEWRWRHEKETEWLII